MKRIVVTIAIYAAVLVLFVSVAIFLRGSTLSEWSWLNPDEAELMAQARAAVLSPVPFSTWTSGTTGPFWVLFLALLGKIGFPLTIVFAHLLSAVLIGIMGFVVLVLFRRTFGLWIAVAISVVWWLPLVLIYPVGSRTDFGALETELLPSLLVLLAALVPSTILARRPWIFVGVGVLGGLAIGSKYQAIPLVLGLIAIQLIALREPIRKLIAPALFWAAGVAAPFVAVAIALVTSPSFSPDLLAQNLSFLGSYAGGVSLQQRISGTTRLLLSQVYFIGAILSLVWLFFVSDRRAKVSRVVMVLAGLAAVYAGGNAFPHYLIVLYVAIAIGIAVPLKPAVVLLPTRTLRTIALSGFAALMVALLVVGAVFGKFTFASPASVAASVSPNSVIRSAALAKLCPAGSLALVWGWAPEFYVNYSWRNAVPFMNTLGIATNPTLHAAGAAIVTKAVAESDCVVDAVGSPFFAVGPESSLTLVYPGVSKELAGNYRVVGGLLDCDACTVYVRN